MTILFAGGEDVDFAQTNGVYAQASNYRSGFARCALNITGGGASTNPPVANFATTPLWSSAVSAFWFHEYVFNGSGSNGTGANYIWLSFYDPSGVCRLMVRGTGTGGQLKISKRSAAGTVTDLVTSPANSFVAATGYKLDIYVNYAVSGTVTLYLNGVQIMTYSGDVTTDGATQIQQFLFSDPGSGYFYQSEFIVADVDTRAMNLCLLNSTTAGAAQAWTGTAANVVNNSAYNDATYIYSDTANQIQEYKPAALPSGVYTVDAVVMSARAMRGSSGPQNMQFVTRIASTDYTSSSKALTTSFANYNNIQATNPATSAAWITSDLVSTNFQFGLKSIT